MKTCNLADQKVIFGSKKVFSKLPFSHKIVIFELFHEPWISYNSAKFWIFWKLRIFKWSFLLCFDISITNYFIEHAIIMTRPSIAVKVSPAKSFRWHKINGHFWHRDSIFEILVRKQSIFYKSFNTCNFSSLENNSKFFDHSILNHPWRMEFKEKTPSDNRLIQFDAI